LEKVESVRVREWSCDKELWDTCSYNWPVVFECNLRLYYAKVQVSEKLQCVATGYVVEVAGESYCVLYRGL